MGPVGYLGGANTVTIGYADYCTLACQEDYPDEFCDMYPPEGVPDKPRAMGDWGTKYNITSNLIRDGIKKIHDKGGKVILAYGGYHVTKDDSDSTGYNNIKSGIAVQPGGGEIFQTPDKDNKHARHLAARIQKNIADWDLDGVDFFYLGNGDWSYETDWSTAQITAVPGAQVVYSLAVIKELRRLVGPSKTISYSTRFQPFSTLTTSYDSALISAAHPYMDFINLGQELDRPPYDDFILSADSLAEIELLGIPMGKLGRIVNTGINDRPGGWLTTEEVQAVINQVKELGMGGVSLFTINKENEEFKGEYIRMMAESMYL